MIAILAGDFFMSDEITTKLAAVGLALAGTPTEDFLEAMNVLTCVEYEQRLRGTLLHAKAVEMLNEARTVWRQKWKGKPCPCCGKLVV